MKNLPDFAKPLRVIVGLQFIAIVALTGINVVCRYFLNAPIYWAEEIVLYITVWMVFLGAACCSWDEEHTSLNLVVARLPLKLQFFVYTIRQAAILAFCGISAFYGIPLLTVSAKQRTGSLNMPASWWRLPGVVGIIIIALFTLLRYLKDIMRLKTGDFTLRDAGE